MYSKWQEAKDERILELIQKNPAKENKYMELSNKADNLIKRIRQHNKDTQYGGRKK